MKKTIVTITLCFLLAIAAPLAAAAGESAPAETQTVFSLDSGVTWDSSIEEIVSLEGEPDPEYSGPAEDYQLLYYENKAVGQGYTAELGIVLNNAGELLAAVYYISDVRDGDFAVFQDAFNAAYGPLAESEMRRFLSDMSAFGMFATYEEYEAVADQISFANWELADGTYIALFGQEDTLFTIAMNEERILAMDAAAGE